MSLEQALNDCTLAIKELIGVMSRTTTVAEIEAPVHERASEEHVRLTPEVERAYFQDEHTYFHDEAHKAVYKFGTTDPLNGIQARCAKITAAQYAVLHAQYAALTAAVIAGKPTEPAPAADTQPAGSATQTSPTEQPGNGGEALSASTTSAPDTAAQTATSAPTWEADVLPALQQLAKKPGDAGRSLKALLVAEGVALVPPLKAKYAADYAPLVAKIAAAQVA